MLRVSSSWSKIDKRCKARLKGWTALRKIKATGIRTRNFEFATSHFWPQLRIDYLDKNWMFKSYDFWPIVSIRIWERNFSSRIREKKFLPKKRKKKKKFCLLLKNLYWIVSLEFVIQQRTKGRQEKSPNNNSPKRESPIR